MMLVSSTRPPTRWPTPANGRDALHLHRHPLPALVPGPEPGPPTPASPSPTSGPGTSSGAWRTTSGCSPTCGARWRTTTSSAACGPTTATAGPGAPASPKVLGSQGWCPTRAATSRRTTSPPRSSGSRTRAEIVTRGAATPDFATFLGLSGRAGLPAQDRLGRQGPAVPVVHRGHGQRRRRLHRGLVEPEGTRSPRGWGHRRPARRGTRPGRAGSGSSPSASSTPCSRSPRRCSSGWATSPTSRPWPTPSRRPA